MGRPDHGAAFDLVVGSWGEEATSSDRYSVCLDYRTTADGSAFMVVEKPETADALSDLARGSLRRSEVVGTPFAAQIFAIVDAIYMTDLHLQEITNWFY